MSRRLQKRTQVVIGLVSLVLLGMAVALPTGWYDNLPKAEGVPDPPLKGVTLLRICLGVDALLMLVVAVIGWLPSMSETSRGMEFHRLEHTDEKTPWISLFLLTLLALALRILRSDSDLWLDEIVTVLEYRDVPALHIVTAYTASGNHLLNTLLVKTFASVFNEREWAIRLPAILFGAASVPLQYFLARIVLNKKTALMATFLLAVSYHHIFFSQNARGYSGFVFSTILGTVLYFGAIRSNRPSLWAWYALIMFFSLSNLLLALFVVVGHVVCTFFACAFMRMKQQKTNLLLRNAALSYLGLGALSLLLYACVIPQVYAYVTSVYQRTSTGYVLFSTEHLRAWSSGITAGMGGMLTVAVVILVVAALGAFLFCRVFTFYCLVLSAPILVSVAATIALRSTVSPRFFIWLLPVGFICLLGSLDQLGNLIAGSDRLPNLVRNVSRYATTAATVVLLLTSVISLVRYYRVPKQPNRKCLQWVASRKSPGDHITAVYLAKWGLHFYGRQFGMRENDEYSVVHSVGELRKIEGRHKSMWLLDTFPRAGRLEFPDLYSYIDRHYEPVIQFASTIKDGEITVWRRKTRSNGSTAF